MDSNRKQPSRTVAPVGFKAFKEKGNYALGWILIGAALVDGAFDPFAGLTAPALLASGLGLLGVDSLGDLVQKGKRK